MRLFLKRRADFSMPITRACLSVFTLVFVMASHHKLSMRFFDLLNLINFGLIRQSGIIKAQAFDFGFA